MHCKSPQAPVSRLIGGELSPRKAMLLQLHVPGSTRGKAEDTHSIRHIPTEHMCTPHTEKAGHGVLTRSHLHQHSTTSCIGHLSLAPRHSDPLAHGPVQLLTPRPHSPQVLISQASTIHCSCWHSPCNNTHMQTQERELLIQGKS